MLLLFWLGQYNEKWLGKKKKKQDNKLVSFFSGISLRNLVWFILIRLVADHLAAGHHSRATMNERTNKNESVANGRVQRIGDPFVYIGVTSTSAAMCLRKTE